MTEIAYCDAAGVVGFGEKTRKGTLPIGKLKCARSDFTAHCRLAYDNRTWLVPGVPEAPNQTVGVDALMAFRQHMINLDLIAA